MTGELKDKGLYLPECCVGVYTAPVDQGQGTTKTDLRNGIVRTGFVL